jgi:hypothetical protein
MSETPGVIHVGYRYILALLECPVRIAFEGNSRVSWLDRAGSAAEGNFYNSSNNTRVRQMLTKRDLLRSGQGTWQPPGIIAAPN